MQYGGVNDWEIDQEKKRRKNQLRNRALVLIIKQAMTTVINGTNKYEAFLLSFFSNEYRQTDRQTETEREGEKNVMLLLMMMKTGASDMEVELPYSTDSH